MTTVEPQYNSRAITVDGKTYEVLRLLTYGEVIKIRTANSNLLGLSQHNLDTADEAGLAALTAQIMTKTNEQDALVADILQGCISGMTDEALSKLGYLEAAVLFNELYELSTIKRKN